MANSPGEALTSLITRTLVEGLSVPHIDKGNKSPLDHHYADFCVIKALISQKSPMMMTEQKVEVIKYVGGDRKKKHEIGCKYDVND